MVVHHRVRLDRRWPGGVGRLGQHAPGEGVDGNLHIVVTEATIRWLRRVDAQRVLGEIAAVAPAPGRARRAAPGGRSRWWRWRASRRCSTGQLPARGGHRHGGRCEPRMGNEACGGACSLSGPSIEDQNLDVTVELALIDQLMGRRQFGLERGVDVTGVHMVTSHDDVHVVGGEQRRGRHPSRRTRTGGLPSVATPRIGGNAGVGAASLVSPLPGR